MAWAAVRGFVMMCASSCAVRAVALLRAMSSVLGAVTDTAVVYRMSMASTLGLCSSWGLSMGAVGVALAQGKG